MKITKNLVIHSITAERPINPSFRIILVGDPGNIGDMDTKWPSLELDPDTCRRFGIPMTMEIVGRTLECSIESRELSDKDGLTRDDVPIDSLEEVRRISQLPKDSRLVERIKHVLTLDTCRDEDEMVTRYPNYSIPLQLSEEEYDQFKRELNTNTVCRVSFCLKQ